MKTKALVRFLNRMAHYSADVELVDVFARSVTKLATPNSQKIFDKVAPGRHPTLFKRKSSDASRKLAIAHLKSTIGSAHIKDLYEDVSMYLNDLLAAAIRHGIDPARLVGEHDVKTDANTLLRLGSWDGVVQYVARSVFRKLEDERSTKALLRKMDAKLGLGVDAAIIDAALPYLDARHVLVHDDGVVDEDYVRQYPQLRLSPGDSLAISHSFVTTARTAIAALVQEVDAKAIARSVVGSHDVQP